MAFAGNTVDGNDVLSVYNAITQAAEKVRKGDGPVIVENVTYRWRGHSKSDRNLYRTQEEIDEWKKFDPIVRFSQVLIDAKILTPEEVQIIDQQALDAIQKAAEVASNMPEPSPENMEAEVYAL
jgi:acetoin:2,6-dichlorophenolindophenol oxidoreductase subunit alpha